MKKSEKKMLYVGTAILLAVIVIMLVVALNLNTQSSIIKQTEDIAQQATETSSTTGYITTQDHLKELSAVTKDTESTTATSDRILKGYTAYINGTKVTGTMNNYSGGYLWINGDNGTFKTGQSHTYSNGSTTNDMVVFNSKNSGYFDSSTKLLMGTGSDIAAKVKVGSSLLGVSGTYTSDATATADRILKGYTAYVNGTKITGTMTDQSGSTVTASSVTTASSNVYFTIPTAGYYNTSSKVGASYSTVASKLGITADKITSGKTVAGVTGTAGGSKVLKSWCPNYGEWTSSSDMYTKDTYSYSATSGYILVIAENGGSVYQYSSPSCSNGTVTLISNAGAGVVYYFSKTESATITLTVAIRRDYSTYPNSTLKVYAFKNY
jgi:hypothetical protein